MFNSNAFKTSIMFLLLILSGIAVRMLLVGDTDISKERAQHEIANILCAFSKDC